MRVCPECSREFHTGLGDRHKRCSVCRLGPKVNCACGKLMKANSKRCGACNRLETAARTGSLNGNWKGGKTYHKKGYVMRSCPGHPRATQNSSYVFEHILVMEEYLGRYLLPGENVHHKYGVRDDNRLEVLELWTTPQPSGIRASDAVVWAREVLARYDGKI
jgi:hypothetical protein